jgi:hypothetical protein
MQSAILLALGLYVQPHLPKQLESTYGLFISWSGPSEPTTFVCVLQLGCLLALALTVALYVWLGGWVQGRCSCSCRPCRWCA